MLNDFMGSFKVDSFFLVFFLWREKIRRSPNITISTWYIYIFLNPTMLIVFVDPIGSMGMIYLPTFTIEIVGTYTIHWILWGCFEILNHSSFTRSTFPVLRKWVPPSTPIFCNLSTSRDTFSGCESHLFQNLSLGRSSHQPEPTLLGTITYPILYLALFESMIFLANFPFCGVLWSFPGR